MPIEIASRDFEFTGGSEGEQNAVSGTEDTAQPSEVGGRLMDKVADKRRSGTPEAVAPRPAMTGPVLKHIPLHDLEGFWWVSIILSIWRGVKGVQYAANSQSQAEADTFRRFANDMFTNSDIRRKIMTNNYTFKNATRLLHRYFHVAGRELENARSVLTKAFRAAESDLSAIKCTVPNNVYSDFILAYEAIGFDLIKGGDFDLAPMNATFLKKQEDPNPPLAGLSLDSRKAQLGKRRRTDTHFEDALDIAANDADAALTASTSAKRLKHRDDDSVLSQSKQEDDKGPAIADADQGKDSATNVSGEASEEA